MESYIFIRTFKINRPKRAEVVIPKGYFLHLDSDKWELLGPKAAGITQRINKSISLIDILDEMRIHLLHIDADLFKTAFHSFGYTNWLNEKKASIDERGDPLYPTLTKTPETLIMYLMELGVPADTLIRYIYGPENKYLEYKYLVQEFGKMI